jgi:hypothetical protein
MAIFKEDLSISQGNESNYHTLPKRSASTIIQNDLISNPLLSCAALKLICIGLSYNGDYQFNKRQLVKHFKEGMHTLERAMKELEKFGYLHKTRARNKKTGEMDGWEWHFCEVPITEEEFKKSSPQGDFPVTVKSPPNKNDYINKKENNNKKAEPKTPTAVVVPSYIEQKGNKDDYI